MSCLSLMLALSMHIGLEGKYNSIHPHARCQKDALISGVYYNSEELVCCTCDRKKWCTWTCYWIGVLMTAGYGIGFLAIGMLGIVIGGFVAWYIINEVEKDDEE